MCHGAWGLGLSPWTLRERGAGGNWSVSGFWGRRSPPLGQGDLFRKLSATLNLCVVGEDWLTACSYWPIQKPFSTGPGGGSLHQAQRELTMSTTFAMTRMKMANMAQVFLAQRVRSIQVEKATSFLGKA